jgi:predicted RNase H-like HicB family nuclease
MPNRLEDYMRLYYSIEVIPDQTTEGSLCYVASHPELPGCMSHGDTTEEAINNLSEAKRLYISTLLRKGEDVPFPRSETKVIWEVVGADPMTPADKPVFGAKINAIENVDRNKEEIPTV